MFSFLFLLMPQICTYVQVATRSWSLSPWGRFQLPYNKVLPLAQVKVEQFSNILILKAFVFQYKSQPGNSFKKWHAPNYTTPTSIVVVMQQK